MCVCVFESMIEKESERISVFVCMDVRLPRVKFKNPKLLEKRREKRLHISH